MSIAVPATKFSLPDFMSSAAIPLYAQPVVNEEVRVGKRPGSD